MPGKRATAMCVWRIVLPSHRCFTPPSWGTPCDINTIYASLNSAFSRLQFRRRQYGSTSFVQRLLPPKHAKCREIPRKFDLTAVQGHRSQCQWKAHMCLPISH